MSFTLIRTLDNNAQFRHIFFSIFLVTIIGLKRKQNLFLEFNSTQLLAFNRFLFLRNEQRFR